MIVNWSSVEIVNENNKRTYYKLYITDMPVNMDNVAEFAECARARWKIENKTFNVLKAGGYNLEHNLANGNNTLSNLLVVINLIAFPFHTAAYLADISWRKAINFCGAKYSFFERLCTIVIFIIFLDWRTFFNTMADPKSRPP